MVVVALGTAAIAGNSLIAAVITIAGGLFILSRVTSRTGQAETQSDRPPRLDNAPFTFTFTWKLSTRPDLEVIENGLASQGLTAEPDGTSGADLVMRGGSILWTRIFGGFFVALHRLPMRAEVSVDQDAEDLWQLELRVSDRLGLAVRDAVRERRPKMAAERIRELVEKSLEDSGELPARE